MLKILTVGAAFALGIVSAQAQAPDPQLSAAECAVLWQEVSVDGSLAENDADDIVVDFEAADEDGDGELTLSEFVAACADGNVRGTSTTGPGAGTR
jgi:hypothetical protein